jgi:hypothetical protein
MTDTPEDQAMPGSPQEVRRREVARLATQEGLGERAIAERIGVSSSQVGRDLDEAIARGEVDEAELPMFVVTRSGRLYPRQRRKPPTEPASTSVDWQKESDRAKVEEDEQREHDRQARRELALLEWEASKPAIPTTDLSPAVDADVRCMLAQVLRLQRLTHLGQLAPETSPVDMMLASELRLTPLSALCFVDRGATGAGVTT